MLYTSGTNRPPNSNVSVTFDQGGAYVASVTAWNRDRTQSVTNTVVIDVGSAPAFVSAQWTPSQISPGQSAVLSWTTVNASTVSFSVPGGIPASGTGSANGSVTVSFAQVGIGRAVLTATGIPGTRPATAQANVVIQAVAPTVAALTWSPGTITSPASSTLTWSATDADRVDLEIPNGTPGSLTNQPPSGSASIAFGSSVSGIITATATASRAGATGTRTAQLDVLPQPVPPPVPQILGSFTGPTFISQTGQDQVNLSVLGPDSGPYSYVVTGSPSVTFDTSSGNPPVGTFNYPLGAFRASLNLVTPHAQTVLTATISRPGYQSYTQSLTVPARATPPGSVEFTRAGTSGTWSVPPGVTAIRVTVVGAGGGGATGSEDDPFLSGGGGGGSGGILQTNLSVSPGDEISYQVGSGGSGAISPGTGGRPGSSGTVSNIGYRGTFYVATGGAGGGESGGNIGDGHSNGGGAGGTPGGTAGSPGESRRGESAGRNLMPGGAGGTANPYGFGGAGAPGVPAGDIEYGTVVFDAALQGDVTRHTYPEWSSLMNENAVWEANIFAPQCNRSYTFTAPASSGPYAVQLLIDNFATVRVDGVSVISGSNTFASEIWQETQIDLTQGNHTLSWTATNTGFPGGIAVRVFYAGDSQNAATPLTENGQPGTGHGAGGGGGAGGRNDRKQGSGASGSGGYVRIEWG